MPVAPTDEMRAARARVDARAPGGAPGPARRRVGDQATTTRGCSSTCPGSPTTPRRRSPRSTAGTPKDVVNWVASDVLAYLNETGPVAGVLPLAPEMLAELVGLVADGTISRSQAKDVLAECLREDEAADATIVEERGLAQVSDEGELGAVVDAVLAANADVVDEYRAGDDKARKKKRGFLMGEVMKATAGQRQPPGPQPAPRPEARRLSVTVTPPRFHCAMDSRSARTPRTLNRHLRSRRSTASQLGVVHREQASTLGCSSRRSTPT